MSDPMSPSPPGPPPASPPYGPPGYGPPGSTPPPYPPGYGPGPYGGWIPPRPGLSAALVTVAVLNILYALGCGCTTFVWASWLTVVTSGDHEQATAMLQEGMDLAEQQSLKDARSDDEQARIRNGYAVIRKHDLVGRIGDALFAPSVAPAKSRLRTLGWVGAALQIAFLATGVMLLMRARVARALGIAGCLAAIVVHILTAMDFRTVALSVHREVAPVLDEIIEQEGLQDLRDRGAILDAGQESQAIAEAGPVFAGGVASLWPFIALLMLALSAGVKRDLGLEPPLMYGA